MLAKVLASARRSRWRVRAGAAQHHYAARGALEASGSRWDPGGPARSKGWFVDVLDEDAGRVEQAFLADLAGPDQRRRGS